MPENIVIIAGINELKSSFCVILSRYFSIFLNNFMYSPQCRRLDDIYRLGEYPPLATSTSVNSYLLNNIRIE